MISVALSVLDRCIDLANRRESVNRSMYFDFIEPLSSDVQTVHENYLDKFSEYRQYLERKEHLRSSETKIVQDMLRDSMYSQHLRENIISSKSAVEENSKSKFTEMIEYLESINDYLDLKNPAISTVAHDPPSILDTPTTGNVDINSSELFGDLKVVKIHGNHIGTNSYRARLFFDIAESWTNENRTYNSKTMITAVDNIVQDMQYKFGLFQQNRERLKAKLLNPI